MHVRWDGNVNIVCTMLTSAMSGHHNEKLLYAKYKQAHIDG